ASPEAPWEAAPLMWPAETAQLTRHAPPAPADAAAAVPEGGAAAALVPEGGEIERAVTAIWEEVLGRTGIGRTDNFFDLGGQSLLLLRLQARLAERFGRRLALPELFHHPTVAALAAHLAAARVPVGASAAAGAGQEGPAAAGEPIAVIGMAGRFPGAEDVDALW